MRVSYVAGTGTVTVTPPCGPEVVMTTVPCVKTGLPIVGNSRGKGWKFEDCKTPETTGYCSGNAFHFGPLSWISFVHEDNFSDVGGSVAAGQGPQTTPPPPTHPQSVSSGLNNSQNRRPLFAIAVHARRW